MKIFLYILLAIVVLLGAATLAVSDERTAIEFAQQSPEFR